MEQLMAGWTFSHRYNSIEKDFTREPKRNSITGKGILFELKTVTDSKVNKLDVDFIRKFRSDDHATDSNQ
jgi:hypothetical protein